MEPFQIEIVNKSVEGAPFVRINGRRADFVTYNPDKAQRLEIRVNDAELADWLKTFTLSELRNQFEQIQLVIPPKMESPVREVRAYFPGDRLVIVLITRVDILEWANPWSLRMYATAVSEIARGRGMDFEGVTSDPASIAGIGLSFYCLVRSPDSVLGDEVCYWIDNFRLADEEATAQLLTAQHANSLTATFNFPPAVATACEQYLLYFVQFLADLGIEAEAEVKHEAAEVLFRVTPAEGREALERVREALDAYLSLPTDPSFAVVAAQETDLAVKQLEFNVHQLKGQLMLAQMYLEAKDRSIEALELSNYRLRQLAGGEVQEIGRGGTAPAASAGEDTEAIIEGIVSVKDVEKGGVVVHTTEIVRRLKRRFGW